MGKSGTGSSGQADSAEEVELDWTHPWEAIFKHHMPDPDLEPTGKGEERPASQLLEARHGGTAETAGIQLDKSGSNSPEEDGLTAHCGWPMLKPRAMGLSK